MRRSSQPWALAAAAYVVLTIALTWPLALTPRTLVPSDLGDPLLNIWIPWWNATTVPLTEAWWNGPQFYPFRGVMAMSESLLGLAPITTPVILLSGDPVLAYNIAFLLSFPLCGLSAHFLVFTLTRRHDLSFLGGLAFAFAPFRMPQIAHIQVLSAYWMPLALASLHRAFAGGPHAARWAWGFAGAWLMQALACGYYFFFLSVLAALWLAWFGLRRGRKGVLLHVLLAWAIAVAAIAPLLYGYWRISTAYNLRRSIDEIRQFSADILSVFKAWDRSLVWGWVDAVHRPEATLFPGLTVVVLASVAIVLAWREASRSATGYPRAARVLLALGGLATAISLARALYGPFRIAIGPLQLLSVTSPDKPVSVAALCFCIAALLHPAVRFAWTRQSVLAFYALATAVMWLMSLGPSPTLMNVAAIYKAPYAWLMMVPGAEGIRVPVRFWMLGALCLAVTAALGLRLIMERLPRAPRWLPAVAMAGVLIDGWPRPLPMAPVPDRRPSHTQAALRLDVPLGTELVDTIALYRAMHHGRPLINGYSGYFPPHYWVMRQLLGEKDPGVIPRLSELGSLEIVVDHALDPDGTWRAFVAGTSNARIAHTATDYTTFEVAERAERAPVLRGTPLPFTVSDASINLNLGPSVHDDDLYSRWHAGREQRRGDSITVDLGGEKDLAGVRVLVGGYSADYPRELLVESSSDGQTFTTAWSGPTALLALGGAFERPRETPISIPLSGRTRFLRLTQTASDPKYYWSIAELQVLGVVSR